jgi:hypothetical protein
MEWIAIIYCLIGGALCWTYGELINEPPEYDSEWELHRTVVKSQPLATIPAFLTLFFLWPVILMFGRGKE